MRENGALRAVRDRRRRESRRIARVSRPVAVLSSERGSAGLLLLVCLNLFCRLTAVYCMTNCVCLFTECDVCSIVQRVLVACMHDWNKELHTEFDLCIERAQAGTIDCHSLQTARSKVITSVKLLPEQRYRKELDIDLQPSNTRKTHKLIYPRSTRCKHDVSSYRMIQNAKSMK